MNKIKMTYDPEADVLAVELNDKPIDYATETGNVIVHFSSDGVPVYLEILEAVKFLRNASTLLYAKSRHAHALAFAA